MPRSLKKGPFIDLSLQKKVDAAIAIAASTFFCKDKSINGPFLSDLGIISSSYLFF